MERRTWGSLLHQIIVMCREGTVGGPSLCWSEFCATSYDTLQRYPCRTKYLKPLKGNSGNPACVCQSSALPVPDTIQQCSCRTKYLGLLKGNQGNPACVCQSSALPVPDTLQRYPCRTKCLGPLKGNRTEEASQAVLIGNGVGGGIHSRFSTQFLVPFVKI